MFDKISPGELVPLVAIGSGCIVALAAIVAGYLRKSRRDEMETTLKLEMIERGMSADDIERVLHARMTGAEQKSPTGRPVS